MSGFYPHLRPPVCPARPPTHITIAPQTGPLDPIRGSRILLVADSQNLVCSCRDLGYKLSWARLGERLREAASRAFLHVVYSRSDPNDRSRWDYFTARGWTPHVKLARTVHRHGGRVERDSNIDNHLAFFAGVLASRLPVDFVVVGSGDGQLVSDVSDALAKLASAPAVVSLSVAGSTARRLDARICNLLAVNVEIGLDAMRPMTASSSLAD